MIPQVADPRVRNEVRLLYMGSGLLFVVNIALGVMNVFTEGDLPRWQVLTHFHAGTIGWVTLSVIATTVWVYTGDRRVSEGYVVFTRLVTALGFLAVAGYIAAFGLAFGDHGPFWLLPLFGIPAGLVILGAFIFTAAQLGRQETVTTVHLLLFGALLVASLGATMGIIWGLTYSTGIDPYPSGGDGIAAHAAPMDMYLALAFAALVEAFVRQDDARRWTHPGLWQMIFGVAAAVVIAAGAFVGFFQVAPVGMLFFLLSFGFYFGRMGWRTFKINPFGPGRSPALFWGGLALPVYIMLFVVLVLVFFIPERPVPHALAILFVHVTFVGAGTNLLLAVQSSFPQGTSFMARFEPWALWTMNVGFLVFMAGEFAGERREGALLMALGVLMALFVVWVRLARGNAGRPGPPRPWPHATGRVP